jgi:hypothetical protein
MTMPKIASTGGFFLLGKQQHVRQPWTKVDAIGRYHVQKSNVQEGQVCSVDGAPHKEREKRGASG